MSPLGGDPTAVRWRLHLTSPPERVHGFLATDEGRAKFWAESAVEVKDEVVFTFASGLSFQAKIIDNRPPRWFAIAYAGSSMSSFELSSDGRGGTDLVLTDKGIQPTHRAEIMSGWVSVLLALKAACDFGVDLRNHDSQRTWDHGFCDN